MRGKENREQKNREAEETAEAKAEKRPPQQHWDGKRQNRRPHRRRTGCLSVCLAAVLVIVLAGAAWKLGFFDSGSDTVVITSADLETAVCVSELSSAEFTYNGIAEKYDDDTQEIICYIAYHATVKVGIDMEEVTFVIDDEARTVTPVLPEIEINVASVDEDSLSYIPQDPDLSLSEIITLCKADAINEANSTQSLYEIAEENLRSAIEALLSPLLDAADYTLIWESTDKTEDTQMQETADGGADEAQETQE